MKIQLKQVMSPIPTLAALAFAGVVYHHLWYY